jgi:hypothetical protein
MASVAGAYDAAKAAFQMLQGYNSLKTEAAKNAAIVDIQHHVVETQRGLSAAMEEIDALKQEVVRLKDWSGEKKRYDLTPIGERAVVYAEKPDVEEPKAPHWLCQQCFDDTHKSALQFRDVVAPMGGLGMMAVWTCNRCKAEIRTGRHTTPAHPDKL